MAQNSQVQNQQREFVRVDDTLPLAWRRIDAATFAQIMNHYNKYRTFPPRIHEINQLLSSLDVTDKLRQLEQKDPLMAQILSRLDQKLNLLLRLFHPGEAERPMVLTVVNLSGGGIAFMDKNPGLAHGDLLEMRLALSVDALQIIECFAKVMTIDVNAASGMTRIGCRYEPILDQDRERMIQYIFKRQSERLRAKRGF